MAIILGLDPASKYGWSLFDNDGKYIVGGVEEFSYPTKSKKNADVPKGKKWSTAKAWLDYLMTTHDPDFVFCEDVKRHSSQLASHAYGYLRYSTEAACYDQWVKTGKCKFYPIGVGVWKKIITGDGSAEKTVVQNILSGRYPDIVWCSEDHSDSSGIALGGIDFIKRDALHELLSSQGGKKKKEPKPKKEKKPKKS